MKIWSLSWKNVWRNKTRSSIVIIAVTLGICGGIFLISFFMGMVKQRVNDIIKNELGHIQIHNPGYLENQDIKKTIHNTDEIIDKLKQNPSIIGISPRTIVNAMINSPQTGTGVKLIGVIPEKEEEVTNIHEMIADSATAAKKLQDSSRHTIRYLEECCGQYFNEGRDNEIVIGQQLAEKLKVRVRSKVVATFQNANGELTGGAFRVAGIFITNNSTFDETMAFVKKDNLNRLAALDKNDAHEISLLLDNFGESAAVSANLQEKFPDLKVRTWKEIKPEISMTSDMMKSFNYIFIFIILLALGFGIVNTMLMVVLERIKELGMLMAIGMNKLKVFMMIMYETVFLTLIGALVGMILSYFLILYFGDRGVELPGLSEGFEAMGYSTTIFPVLGLEYFINIAIMVIGIGILASIYPAIKALKNNPAEAIRTE